MVTAARCKTMNKRLSAIFRPEWSTLDFIEIPNEKWFLSEDKNELYEFDDGIFVAHPKIEDNVFHTWGTKKVLPANTIVVDVETEEDSIFVITESPETAPPPTWRTIDEAKEMDEWLLRRNKRHYQQMHIENRPPVREEFEPVLSEQGTSSIVDEILAGTFDPAQLDSSEEMAEFIKKLKMTPEEKKLRVPDRMSKRTFSRF